MNILVTGAKGFVGKNLAEALKNIRDGKDRTRPDLKIEEIYLYDIDSSKEELETACEKTDFVFNLAGVNRPKDNSEFIKGNFGFAEELLNTLKRYNNKCPVMLSSSVQATLIGRYDSDYGRSKKAGEELFFNYAAETGARVLVYRFPNLFGKWCRPNYNSAVATFCYNTANDLPITVNDSSTELELLYIDDLVAEMLDALEGKEHHCEFDGVKTVLKEDGKYCAAPTTHFVTLGEIVDLLESFKTQPQTLLLPEIPENIRVNFANFMQGIESVGGIDITLTAAEANVINTYTRRNIYSAGNNHLDGKAALGYARCRKIDSDWHRVERQRNVIQAVATKTKDLSITELNDLLNNVLPIVQTNLTKLEITELLLLAPKYRGATIQQMTVPISGNYGGMRGLGGRSLFSVDFDTNSKALREFIYGETE